MATHRLDSTQHLPAKPTHGLRVQFPAWTAPPLRTGGM